MADSKAIANTDKSLAAVPDWLKDENDASGTDHIGRDDINMPRLGLAQQMSHELDPSHSKYLEALKVGELFNTITGDIYGKGPLEFAIVRADRPRYIEFFPREAGGGVKDMNVPENDPRTQFGPNGEVPVATKFYDFYVVRLPLPEDITAVMDQTMVLSLKSTGLKVAKQINTLLMLRRPKPLFASRFSLTTGMDQNKHGKFAVYQVASAGWVSREEFHVLKQLAETLKDKEIKFERDGAEDIDDSMASNPEDGSGAPPM
jgi:hypothetical protein